MPDIDSIQFDHSAWQSIEKKPHTLVWADDVKRLTAVLSLEFFSSPPEISVKLNQIDQIRFLYRMIAHQSQAGLMSAEVVAIENTKCIETVFKMVQPNRGHVYVGSLTIPFAECSYVIKVQCLELGFAGVREAVVLDRLLQIGMVSRSAEGKIVGWSRDPYDPGEQFHLMPNLAEAEEYDAEFPDHALSRVRKTLNSIKGTMRFSDDLKNAPPFDP